MTRDDEPERVVAARVEALRLEAAARQGHPEDTLAEAIGNAVSEAIVDGAFLHALHAKGWRLVHAVAGQVPPPPMEWAEQALNLMEPGWIDPLGLLDELWRSAWLAGRDAGAALDEVP